MILLFAALAQAAAPAGPSLEDDRLRLCIEQAASDSATAIATADAWLGEARGADRAGPLQCLGHAYTALLRWPAAEEAFVAAAQAAQTAPEAEPARRAVLWAQAGNAALAGGQAERALARFDAALAAAAAAEPATRGQIAADRARALVALGRLGEAGQALAEARREAPDAALVWLLSATLSRRESDLAAARPHIEVALSLAPDDPEIRLEAGVIAMLLGDAASARQSWQAVVQAAPASPAGEAARGYLAQIGSGPAPQGEGR